MERIAGSSLGVSCGGAPVQVDQSWTQGDHHGRGQGLPLQSSGEDHRPEALSGLLVVLQWSSLEALSLDRPQVKLVEGGHRFRGVLDVDEHPLPLGNPDVAPGGWRQCPRDDLGVDVQIHLPGVAVLNVEVRRTQAKGPP